MSAASRRRARQQRAEDQRRKAEQRRKLDHARRIEQVEFDEQLVRAMSVGTVDGAVLTLDVTDADTTCEHAGAGAQLEDEKCPETGTCGDGDDPRHGLLTLHLQHYRPWELTKEQGANHRGPGPRRQGDD